MNANTLFQCCRNKCGTDRILCCTKNVKAGIYSCDSACFQTLHFDVLKTNLMIVKNKRAQVSVTAAKHQSSQVQTPQQRSGIKNLIFSGRVQLVGPMMDMRGGTLHICLYAVCKVTERSINSSIIDSFPRGNLAPSSGVAACAHSPTPGKRVPSRRKGSAINLVCSCFLQLVSTLLHLDSCSFNICFYAI